MANGHGGARAGAGKPPRKKPEYSDALKKQFVKEMRQIAEETGKSYARMVLETAYGMHPNLHPTAPATAMKLIAEILVVKESKQTVDVNKAESPTVYLPEVMPKPAEAEKREKEAAASLH
jgi:protein-disulfide isomerase-like protein with CxxC motif